MTAMTDTPPPPKPSRPRFVELSPDRVRRFWKEVSVEPDGQGWAVRLDGRLPKTPSGHSLVLPSLSSAQLVASEWAEQGEFLDPSTMPTTRLAYTAIDRVREAREAVADEIASYAGSDALCYPAEEPRSLVELQTREWAPWLAWAADLGVKLEPATGIIHRPQDEASLDRARALALDLDDYALTGLGMATPLLGSAVLALALQRGALSGEAAFDLSRLDESFQESRWGVDEEAAERTAARRAEAVMLERWFKALAD